MVGLLRKLVSLLLILIVIVWMYAVYTSITDKTNIEKLYLVRMIDGGIGVVIQTDQLSKNSLTELRDVNSKLGINIVRVGNRWRLPANKIADKIQRDKDKQLIYGRLVDENKNGLTGWVEFETSSGIIVVKTNSIGSFIGRLNIKDVQEIRGVTNQGEKLLELSENLLSKQL
ncbi:MAG: hypothetical protein ABIJ43_00030 [Candidatus Beckwithbacteria bacterium]